MSRRFQAILVAWAMLLFLDISVAARGRRPRFEPLPRCPGCVSREDIVAPGIGFDMTFSYATAAIRYKDGRVQNLMKTEAGDEYKQLMIRMSKAPPTRPCYPSRQEDILCRIAHAKRLWNKFLGRPSTPEVGIIAELINAHRISIDRTLEQQNISVKRAILAIPEIPQLSWQDWQDAMEHCGLELLHTYKHIGQQVSEVSAAFAGSSYGLCQHYTDIDTCEDEEADMPYSYVLAVSLSQACFSAANTYMQSAFKDALGRQVTRLDLGLGASNGSEGYDVFWSQIRNAIVDVGRLSPKPLTTLLILGEEGHNPRFRTTIQEALRELLSMPFDDSSLLLELSSDSTLDQKPLWLAARGAAEFAKRTQESPAACKEPARCAAVRATPNIKGGDSGESYLRAGKQSNQVEL